MNQTVNLHLPQFEATDRIHHDDFNDAFDAIDTAMPRIATGSYTGDGEEERFIDLGFTPKAVLVMECDGLTFINGSQGSIYGGIAIPGYPCESTVADHMVFISVEEGGFNVYNRSSSRWHSRTNYNGIKFHYIAIG